MKIRFIYHKPQGERGVGKAIVALTWVYALFYAKGKALKLDYSHEEVWLPDEDGIFIFNNIGAHLIGSQYAGQCFSSTTRGDAEGVRFAPAQCVIGKHPERWDYIEVNVDPERLEVAVAEARRLVGKKYDYLGIFGFINPFPVHSKDKWYCSEVCDWFKVLLRIYPKRHKRISPRRAAYILSKKYGQPVSI